MPTRDLIWGFSFGLCLSPSKPGTRKETWNFTTKRQGVVVLCYPCPIDVCRFLKHLRFASLLAAGTEWVKSALHCDSKKGCFLHVQRRFIFWAFFRIQGGAAFFKGISCKQVYIWIRERGAGGVRGGGGKGSGGRSGTVHNLWLLFLNCK